MGRDLSMFTQHIIAAISVMIHGEITKHGPQIDDDLSTSVTLAQHIIATIVMAILGADQHTQTHSKDINIPRHAEVTKKRPQVDDDLSTCVTLA